MYQTYVICRIYFRNISEDYIVGLFIRILFQDAFAYNYDVDFKLVNKPADKLQVAISSIDPYTLLV